MTHEDCLNILLGGACSNESDVFGFNSYTIELHCAVMKVIARPINMMIECQEHHEDLITQGRHYHVEGYDHEVYRYEIKSIQFK